MRERISEMISNTIIAPAEGPVKLAYTVTETAEALGVSRDTVYNLIYADNDFPVRRLGSRYLIPIKALEAWVNKGWEYEHE